MLPLTKKPYFNSGFRLIHQSGVRGLLHNYGGILSFYKSTPLVISLVLASICTLSIIFVSGIKGQKLFDFIKSIVALGIDIEGGIIGLSLAGLTLVVAFGSDILIKYLIEMSIEKSKKEERIVISGYQTMVAKFAMAVFVQVITMIFCVLTNLILLQEIYVPTSYAHVINHLIVFLLVFLLLYSLILVGQMTLNVFTIGQNHHAVLYMDIAKKQSPTNVDNKDGNSNPETL